MSTRAAMGMLLLALAGLALPLARSDHISDPDEEMPYGCPGRDCIPAILNPKFDDGGWLRDSDRVIGVSLSGDSKAYPTRILDWHEIVDDEVGGELLAITYCPLCGSGVVYDREVAGRVLTFGVSGRLFHNDLVMYDHQTQSLWPQIKGEAYWGEMHGAKLEQLPSELTTWGAWKAAHPDAQALSRDTGYSRDYNRYPYGDYESRERTLFPVENPSRRMFAKTWVYGVERGNDSIAFVQENLTRAGLVTETLDGEPIVAVAFAGGAGSYFTGGRQLRLGEGKLVDEETGERFELPEGIGDRGSRLERPFGLSLFWFAWHEFHPGTRVWPADASPQAPPPVATPGPPAVVVFGGIAASVALFALWRNRWG